MVMNYYTLAIPAGTVTPQAIGGELDWRYESNQVRRYTAQLANAADSVLLEGTLDGTNWWPLAAAHTGQTTPFNVSVSGPVKQIRATKTGTAGIANIAAMI